MFDSQIKEYLADPSKFAVAAAPAASSEPAAEKKEEKKEETEESDDDMGFGLFDQNRYRDSQNTSS